jgi:hypothetical protein
VKYSRRHKTGLPRQEEFGLDCEVVFRSVFAMVACCASTVILFLGLVGEQLVGLIVHSLFPFWLLLVTLVVNSLIPAFY